jgi:hypothetical protein
MDDIKKSLLYLFVRSRFIMFVIFIRLFCFVLLSIFLMMLYGIFSSSVLMLEEIVSFFIMLDRTVVFDILNIVLSFQTNIYLLLFFHSHPLLSLLLFSMVLDEILPFSLLSKDVSRGC